MKTLVLNNICWFTQVPSYYAAGASLPKTTSRCWCCNDRRSVFEVIIEKQQNIPNFIHFSLYTGFDHDLRDALLVSMRFHRIRAMLMKWDSHLQNTMQSKSKSKRLKTNLIIFSTSSNIKLGFELCDVLKLIVICSQQVKQCYMWTAPTCWMR